MKIFCQALYICWRFNIFSIRMFSRVVGVQARTGKDTFSKLIGLKVACKLIPCKNLLTTTTCFFPGAVGLVD